MIFLLLFFWILIAVALVACAENAGSLEFLGWLLCVLWPLTILLALAGIVAVFAFIIADEIWFYFTKRHF